MVELQYYITRFVRTAFSLGQLGVATDEFWAHVLLAVIIYLLLNELIRLPWVWRYTDRVVFITECDTGFGNLLVKRLDLLGFKVFAGCQTAKGEEELKKVSSSRVKTVTMDVTKAASINKAREFVEKTIPPDKGNRGDRGWL